MSTVLLKLVSSNDCCNNNVELFFAETKRSIFSSLLWSASSSGRYNHPGKGTKFLMDPFLGRPQLFPYNAEENNSDLFDCKQISPRRMLQFKLLHSRSSEGVLARTSVGNQMRPGLSKLRQMQVSLNSCF